MQIEFQMNGESRTKTMPKKSTMDDVVNSFSALHSSSVDDLTSSLHTLGLNVANGEGGFDRLKNPEQQLFNGAVITLQGNDDGGDKGKGVTENKANENETKANESGIESLVSTDSRINDAKEEVAPVKDVGNEKRPDETDEKKESTTSQGPEEKESDAKADDDQTGTLDAGSAADEDAEERPRFVVRLRGLPWSAREPEIRAFFSEEEVVEVQIVFLTDGRASGEALVEFASNGSLVTAFLKNRQHIGHRYIEIFKSTPMELDTAAGRCSRPPARPPKSQFVIRMRGLPYSAMETDVESFFGDEPTPSSVHLIKDDLGRPSGEGFVEFLSEVEAIAAMAKHRHHMGHRYIELFRSSPEELMRALGLTSGFLKQLNGGAGLKSACVLMRGLPYSCTESDITKFFQEIEVTPIRIHRKADGAEAYVEFYSIADTDKAMTRHRNYIGRRYIELFRVSYEDMARTVGLPLAASAVAAANHVEVTATGATALATPHQPHIPAHAAHHAHPHPVPQAMQHPRTHAHAQMQPMAGPMNMMMPSPYAYSLLQTSPNAMGGPVGLNNGVPQGVQSVQGLGSVTSTPFGPSTMQQMAGPTTPSAVPPGPPSYYRAAPGPQYYQQQ